ncbi:hypothetical protein MJO28_002149 [Puccinia striiformis f. sp. tritici]|uniref:Uncharacterized protein n=1 Tax=Puccinia striiformis f. sp. tritici TaxID=168172 RepID=A0ACC0EXP2_9BASI|nr:hypothetical protein MJO28_002149 [Puccinia striiformis f. sp. tritici]
MDNTRTERLKIGRNNNQAPRMKAGPTAFHFLPVELIHHIADYVEEQLWPPVDSAITDWNSYPSVASQRDLCALSLVCRGFNRIVSQRLLRNVMHDFKSKSSCEARFDPHRYRWLSPRSFPSQSTPQLIRVLYLYDLFRDLDPAIETKNMAGLLQSLPGIEVLVTTGFCASVLAHTLSTCPPSEVGSLKVLKIFSYAMTVKSILAAFRTFPNLTSLTLDVVNIEGSGNISSHALPSTRASSITQLDLCARLYAPEEYESLSEILKHIVPNLKMVHIHGEYSEELYQVVSMLRKSPIETLLLNFRNKFPESLLSIRLPTLNTLSISTYAYSSAHLLESNMVSSVNKLVVRTSGYPIDSSQLHRAPEITNLKTLQLQSLCKIRDQEEEERWDRLVREWCLGRGISFKNKNSDCNIIKPQDDYCYLQSR